MAGIARDETRHAALAWAVDTWSRTLLPPAARRRVQESRREAMGTLLDAPLPDLSRDARVLARLPDEEEEVRLAGALAAWLV